MLVNGINFKEIHTEYDYLNFKIDNRKIKLVYRIRQYRIIKEQDKTKNFRRNGIKLKHLRKMNRDEEVVTAYYTLYDVKILDLKYKKELIRKLLNIEVMENTPYIEFILDKWERSSYHKKTSDTLMDKEAISLDVLATYFIGGYNQGNILSNKDETKLPNIEVVSLDSLIAMEDSEDTEVEKYYNYIPIMDKKQHEKFMKKRKPRTKFDKFVDLFSFDDHKAENVFWDWVREEYTTTDERYHYKIDRLINPERPYRADWYIVDTDNVFVRDGVSHVISSNLSQYNVGKDNEASMDRILVMEQDNEVYYFDQNIDGIDAKFIKKFLKVVI